MPEETTTEARVIAILSRMEERQEAGFEQIQKRFEQTDHRIDTLREDMQAWRENTNGRLSRLEGGFEQMDKRMSNVESLQRWAIGVMITSWLTLVGLTITVLLKLPS